MTTTHYYGIRHHGPGSARSLLAALQAEPPDLLLVEGPPEGQTLLPALLDPLLRPPVALLVYADAEPARAAYFPFVVFSPEYQAIRFALERGIPVRLIDLPQRLMLPMVAPVDQQPPAPTADPLTELALAAGYIDVERWWDALVEQRRNTEGLFDALHDAMLALRDGVTDDPLTAVREAHMRQCIAQAHAEGMLRVAVVCGAWHTPALRDRAFTPADTARLSALSGISVSATWVPWTYTRLSRLSGYGAGVQSPGWYHYLWETQDHAALAAGWLSHVAQELRRHDLDASTAQVIDAVRLVDTLKVLRGRAFPDLQDLNEAALSVLCHGNPAPMVLIERDLIVGQAMGSVPPTVPTVPLQRDFQEEAARFDLRLNDDECEIVLDLRLPFQRDLSRFLVRTRLLELSWASREDVEPLYEVWRLQWDPAEVIQLIEKNSWGNTVEDASSALALHQAHAATSIGAIADLVDQVLRADLTTALPVVLQHMEHIAALTSDVLGLIAALPALAEALTYGDIRQTARSAIQQVIDGIVPRVLIGLPAVCGVLDDAAAAQVSEAMQRCDSALRLLNAAPDLESWYGLLRRISDQQGVHGRIRGLCVRLVLSAGQMTPVDVVRTMRLALGSLVPPAEAAAWLEGFLLHGAAVLIHDDSLLDVIDTWVTTLPVQEFEAILPLLRRAFSTFQQAELRQIGQRVQRSTPPGQRQQPGVDAERARRMDGTLDDLLGT